MLGSATVKAGSRWTRAATENLVLVLRGSWDLRKCHAMAQAMTCNLVLAVLMTEAEALKEAEDGTERRWCSS